MAFRVKDAPAAMPRLVERGAWAVEGHAGPMQLVIPAVKGIGDSLIYLVDRYPENDYGHDPTSTSGRFLATRLSGPARRRRRRQRPHLRRPSRTTCTAGA